MNDTKTYPLEDVPGEVTYPAGDIATGESVPETAVTEAQVDELLAGVAKYVVFDTETTGIFDFKRPADDPDQPRMASFAAILMTEDGTILSETKHFVKPDGWSMPQGPGTAGEVNGLTDDFLTENGIPIGEVLDFYDGLVTAGLQFAAFNAQFDLKMMRAEFRRAGRDDRFEQTPNFCLMRGLAPYGAEGLPIMRGYIKLREVCDHWGIPLDNAHDAMADARASAEILRRMIADGRVPEAKIHYAKEKPAGKAD